MSLPRTLTLLYPTNFKPEAIPSDYEGEDLFLPRLLHMRAAKVMNLVAKIGNPTIMVVRSEYDAVHEIELELEVVGTEAEVKAVRFQYA